MVLPVVIGMGYSQIENSNQSRIISSHYVISSNDQYDVKAHHIELMNRYYYSSDRNPDFFFNADNQIDTEPKQVPVKSTPPKPPVAKPVVAKPPVAKPVAAKPVVAKPI